MGTVGCVVRTETGHAASLDRRLFADFIHFSQRQYDCLDYDPFHPMIAYFCDKLKLDREQGLWLSTLYMAFYNIGSAYVAFCNSDPLKPLPEWAYKLPVGVQRRNLRIPGTMERHLTDFAKQAQGSLYKFLTRGFAALPGNNWRALQDVLMGVWGNGRWGCYTLGELYQKVNRLKVLPTDIMNDGSTGPRAGLCYLHGCSPDWSVEVLDELAEELFRRAKPKIKTRIWYLPLGHYDYGMLESQLCDFNSLRKGRYYIGRDIDRDQERIKKAEKVLSDLGQTNTILRDVWEAREAVFDRRYLGEFGGWPGRTEEAKTYYVRTGKIADHATIRVDGQFF